MRHTIHVIRGAAARDCAVDRAAVRALPVSVLVLVALALVRPPNLVAQAVDTGHLAHASALDGRSASDDLDSLLARALRVSPAIRAAVAKVDASRHRAVAAGARPDPMLMAGIENLPLGRENQTTSAHGVPTGGGPEPMTMRMIGIGQIIPYRGKLSLRTQAAERETDASEAAVDAARLMVVRDVKDAYYELAFLDQAFGVTTRNANVLGTFIQVTEARYGDGVAGQQDVLKARVEAAHLAESAASLKEQRRTALARLNAVLDRPSDTPVEDPTIPPAIAHAAISDSTRGIRFVSAALGARAADSPLLSVSELQQIAIRQSPGIREHEAMIAAQTARVELARKDVLPDVDISVQYGQRPGLTDMITATVSVPIPLQRRRKQDQLVAEADAQLAALHEEHRTKVNEINAEIARLVSELERERTQLALYVKAILPQGRATVTSATASYQSGKADFLTVLDSQATVFAYETDYFRALSDFGKNLAELERVVGHEVLR
jgi:cobalt-zinc-cadmium efflux system outer membrane protein